TPLLEQRIEGGARAARARGRRPRVGRRAEPVAEVARLLVSDALGPGLAAVVGEAGGVEVAVAAAVEEGRAARADAAHGHRVAVESIIRCGHCRACIAGRYQLCRGRGGLFGHGYVPLDRPPGLWGAYADYMYLDPLSIVHRVRKDIPASLAVMFNPLGAGFRWAVEIPATGPGDSVLVLGPGQRGLASVIAARAAGADTIIVTGLSRDARKLALARELGADHVIDVEREDARARVRELTGGRGAEVVIEVTAN